MTEGKRPSAGTKAAKAPCINDWSGVLFYHVSKIGWFLVEPSNLLAAAALAGSLATLTRFARAGRRLAIAATGALLVIGLSPLPNWLMLPLEMRFPAPDLAGRSIDGIVVLGGAVLERQSAAHGALEVNEAAERILAMADLARRYPQAQILFTGGSGAYSTAPQPEADVLRGKLATLGLASDRVAFENRSVNTWENAVFSKAIAQPKAGETWLLVTSAGHMPRSVGIFRQVGWPVLAYPVDHRTAGWPDAMRGFSTVSDGLRRAEAALREWLGLLVYRLNGRSAALFPAP